VKGHASEVVGPKWVTVPELQALAARTRNWLDGSISNDSYWTNPGLEPVWIEWFTVATGVEL
jgi:hypothetical protein